MELIDHLNPSVIIDQSRLGGNARSTVGTISDMYAALRLLFSRIGTPAIGLNKYYWKVYRRPEYFRTDVKWKELTEKGNIYILDEPTTGLHASDIVKVMGILENFVDRGNTVIVIEHNTDVMLLADYLIDVGPDGGTKGGRVVFTGTPKEMLEHGDTITAKYLRKNGKQIGNSSFSGTK